MTTTSRVLVQAKYLEVTQTTQYTSTGLKSLLDTCTLTNTDTAPVTVSVHIVGAGGSAGASNRVISQKVLQPDEIFHCVAPSRLDAGDFISTIASVADKVVFRLDGRLVS